MKKVILIATIALLASSCAKESCMARNADGEAIYEVVGEKKCQDQINEAEGEYCECAK
ncbi:hypothetical protein N8987_03530 [Crocinitomix sp.]|nr:hypothetical protein [Crocinitomix sp.]